MSRVSQHVVFAASEVAPFAKTGGLGDVGGAFPRALAAAGARVVVMLPNYKTIDATYKAAMEHVADIAIPMGEHTVPCGLERITQDGVAYYFITNDKYFARDEFYSYKDDAERFAFFSRSILEAIAYIPDFHCSILHCNDWQTALAPLMLRTFYQGKGPYSNVAPQVNTGIYQDITTVFSVHNATYQGEFNKCSPRQCGFYDSPKATEELYVGPRCMNYMKAALLYADVITTVSPTYAEELKTAYYGEGLDWLFKQRNDDFFGIANGIDYLTYNPQDNACLKAPYSQDDLSGKARNKAALQKELGFEVDPNIPLIVTVSRLTEQKGIDLIVSGMRRLQKHAVQYAVLGTSDKKYERSLTTLAKRYPASIAARIAFNPALSQLMYAGADMFLMPSLFEPCGLAQMVAMHYGTLPIVRETGGLRDTVTTYNTFSGEGTGFSFVRFSADEMVDCVLQACDLYTNQKDIWRSLMTQAMSADFSWDAAARSYLALYNRYSHAS